MNKMKSLIGFLLMLTVCAGIAQTRVSESVNVSGQSVVELDFPFADDIIIKTWDKKEVKVDVDVTINNGEDDHIFRLETEATNNTIAIRLDKDMWKKTGRSNENCNWRSELFYTVYLPKSMELKANTISGNFMLEPYGKATNLKTISGDIDLTVKGGIDFKAKTISGEVYSDMDIDYPEGKDGLNQIVGMNVRGKVSTGSPLLYLETISGNIYLRKG